jgi:hypothetical protein
MSAEQGIDIDVAPAQSPQASKPGPHRLLEACRAILSVLCWTPRRHRGVQIARRISESTKEQMMMMNKTSIAGWTLCLGLALTAGTALARGPWTMNRSNTWSYSLMTPQERTEHQNKMRSFKTYDECMAYQDEHHRQMEARAKDKGVTLPPAGKGTYGCDNMKAQGYFK